MDTTCAKSLWSDPNDENPESDVRYAFSLDGKYVLGLAKNLTKSQQSSGTLYSAVESIDGSVVKDVPSLKKTRQKEINVIANSLWSEKKNLPTGLEWTRKGLYIKGRDSGDFHISTLEKIQGCWLSPDKKWLLFNGLDPETSDGELGFSTGWLYNLHYLPPWIKGESSTFLNVTFDEQSFFLAKNQQEDGYEGPGMTEILRLSSPPNKLELPIRGDLFCSTIKGGVLAVSSEGGAVSFFNLPMKPYFKNPADLKFDESFLELAEYVCGWRINPKGESVPVPYSEKHARQLKLLKK